VASSGSCAIWKRTRPHGRGGSGEAPYAKLAAAICGGQGQRRGQPRYHGRR
jgi:hypothetical protein